MMLHRQTLNTIDRRRIISAVVGTEEEIGIILCRGCYLLDMTAAVAEAAAGRRIFCNDDILNEW